MIVQRRLHRWSADFKLGAHFFQTGSECVNLLRLPFNGRFQILHCAFHNFCRVAFVALFVCLCSCDGDLFDSDSRQIAHGYRLKRIGDSSEFALLAPYDTGGLIIDEIGWHKPFILFRASGSEYWDRIDTDHAEHIRISDAQRRLNPVLRSIHVEGADIAWNHLKRHKRMW